MAREQARPFDQLGENDQKAAVDVAVALTVLGTRVPSQNKAFSDHVAQEFTRSYNLVPNVVKYAMRELGVGLFQQNWEFKVYKRGGLMTTEFRPIEANEGDGQIIIKG